MKGHKVISISEETAHSITEHAYLVARGVREIAEVYSVPLTERFMTEEAKREELRHFQEDRSRGPFNLPGGRGGVDPDILPLCDQLNALPGLCTLQSCAGHGETEHSGIWPASLWLWLDERTSRSMDENAHVLANNPLMESVSKCFKPWGHVIWEIMFFGNERGRLDESGAALIDFFTEMVSGLASS